MDYEEMIEPQAVKIEPERPLKKFFQDTLELLTEPTRFFSGRFNDFTLNQALVFCVLIHWLSSFLEWMTRVVKHESLLDGFVKIREQLETIDLWKGIAPQILPGSSSLSHVPSWTMELASVAIDPFRTLIGLVMSTFAIWVGATLLIQKKEDQDPVSFSNLLKMIAFTSSAPHLVGSLLGFLPLNLGTFIGILYVVIVEMVALSVRYKISKLRAFAVTTLPSLVITGLGMCFVGVLIALFLGIVGAILK